MTEETMDKIAALLGFHGITDFIRDGFVTLPQSHAFAVWRIARRTAQGADGYALYWDVTIELRIFYREGKKAGDFAREKLIEAEMRELDGLESEYDYNPDDKLDITLYRFDLQEEF